MIQATLFGRLTADPQEKESSKGDTMAVFTLACQRNKDTADFVKCTAFGSAARVVLDYVKKGHQLVAVGRMELNRWQAADGADKADMKCVINTVQLVKQAKQAEEQSEGNWYD